jgi:hypothetical protein
VERREHSGDRPGAAAGKGPDSIIRPDAQATTLRCQISSRRARSLARHARSLRGSFQQRGTTPLKKQPPELSGSEAKRGRSFLAALGWRARNQKVKRDPNWNWRGVFTVFVINPKGSPWDTAPTMLGTLGAPSCAVLLTL